jgi:protein ImuA
MPSARTDTLAHLQARIDRLESGIAQAVRHVPLGHDEADSALGGGLVAGAMHEVFAPAPHAASATGFVAGLTQLLSGTKFLLWVRQDFSARENGEVSMSGLAELGLDPRRIVMVRASDAENVLRVAADGLACPALGSVVAELWGEARAFDAVASRKLTLAAQQSGVTALMLRFAAQPMVSTAETRWIVRAAHSPPASASKEDVWGAPVIATTLARNRHGPTGQWIMEWKSDECRFREPQAYPQPLAAMPADRSHQTQTGGGRYARHAAFDRRGEDRQRAAGLGAG